ncbi:Hypothetical protein PBC10988_2890 [Planctomycetales bacterium 10988]|nr:Hypothetical protein PBC10988_2890 [Planctomycetales bacterium 10988]
MLCRLFGVSRAGFYRWIRRKPSRQKRNRERIARQSQSVHREVSPDDGSPRMQRELVEWGVHCCVVTVAKVIQEAGLRALTKRVRRRTTTGSEPG